MRIIKNITDNGTTYHSLDTGLIYSQAHIEALKKLGEKIDLVKINDYRDHSKQDSHLGEEIVKAKKDKLKLKRAKF